MLPAAHGTFISQLQRCCSTLSKSSFSTAVPQQALVLYIDGSLRPVGAGAAMYAQFDDHIVNAKLHLGPSSDYTSQTAEFWAAFMALQYVHHLLVRGYQGRSFVIATDSLAVFAVIASPGSVTHRDPVAAQIQGHISRIHKRHPNIQLSSIYTRGHSGITENESADRAAKAAAGGQTGVDLSTRVDEGCSAEA